MKAGYSEKPLSEKLGIKPGHTVVLLNAPSGFLETLGAQLMQVRLLTGMTEDADIIHLFVTSKTVLEEEFPKLKAMLGKHHAIWISWPKRSSAMQTDLVENAVRDIGLKNGLVDVKVCAIDETWSGLKFVYKLKNR